MWDSLLQLGNAEPHFLPRDGREGPWAGAGGGGVRQSPSPPPRLSPGPCSLPLRTVGWAHVPAALRSRTAGENALAFWPLPPTAPHCAEERGGLWKLGRFSRSLGGELALPTPGF